MEKIAPTRLGPQSKSAMDALLKANAADYSEARKTGNPGEIFMMKASQETLLNASKALETDGNAEARQLLNSLLVSREIYQKIRVRRTTLQIASGRY